MPLYPPSTIPPATNHLHPLLKQAIISITFALLLTVSWWFFGKIAQPLASPASWISISKSTLQIYGFLLIIMGFLVTLISLITVLLNNSPTKLLPIVLPPAILYLFHLPANSTLPALLPAGLIIACLIITQLLFSLFVVTDLGLYKKFSLRKLILPHVYYLFIGFGLCLAIPVYFQLSAYPDILPNLLRYQIVEPLTTQVLNRTVPLTSATPSDAPSSGVLNGTANGASPTPGTSSSLPSNLNDLLPNLSQLVPPEVLTQIQQNLSSSNAPYNSTDINQNSLKNIPPPLDLIKQQAIDQFNKLINPILPYLKYIFPLIIFLSILQILLLLRPLFFPLIWIIFHLLLALKIARISVHEEPVEVLEV